MKRGYFSSTLQLTLTAVFRLLALLCITFAPLVAQANDTLIFAASSLKLTLDQIIASPDVAWIGTIKASYAASSQLARQIEAGAPASIFISADQAWMDWLAERKLIVTDSRVDLVGNALVLIAPNGSATQFSIAPGFDLADALGKDGRLAMGEPNSVPAGKYSKAALSKLGIWKSIESRIVAADNVRAALNFVARGEVPLGIVYRSDAMSESSVRIVATFPANTHAPIVYPAAIVAGHDSPAARALLDRLRSAPEQAICRAYGFDAPPK
ncbi:MAG: molybdate ABC transporter substrate-binding protein [Dokdonella sp.]